jgi:cation transport ATPase
MAHTIKEKAKLLACVRRIRSHHHRHLHGHPVRPEARQASARIHELGLTTQARAVANAVARDLTVDEVAADLLPQHKLDRVKAPVAGGHTVAMAGAGGT